MVVNADVVVDVVEVVAVWNTRSTQRFDGGRDPVSFARWVIGQTSEWFDKLGEETRERQRLATLRKMRAELVSWIRPLKKGGRCRRAARVAVLWSVLDAIEACYTLFCGQKRPTDLLWTKYLPTEVQQRLLLGPPFGQAPTTYFHWVLRAANSEAEDELFYVINSRKHQKW